MSRRNERAMPMLTSMVIAMIAFLAYALGDALVSAIVHATGKWEEVSAFGALIACGACAVGLIGGMAWLTFVPERKRVTPPRPYLSAGCAHRGAVPVDLLLTGEHVAWLCPECGEQLAAGWQPPVPPPPGTITMAQFYDGTATLAQAMRSCPNGHPFEGNDPAWCAECNLERAQRKIDEHNAECKWCSPKPM